METRVEKNQKKTGLVSSTDCLAMSKEKNRLPGVGLRLTPWPHNTSFLLIQAERRFSGSLWVILPSGIARDDRRPLLTSWRTESPAAFSWGQLFSQQIFIKLLLSARYWAQDMTTNISFFTCASLTPLSKKLEFFFTQVHLSGLWCSPNSETNMVKSLEFIREKHSREKWNH